MNSSHLKKRLKNRSVKDIHIRSGRIKARKGHAEELFLILNEAAERMQALNGNILYLVNREEENQEMINTFELWESREHHKHPLANSEIMLLFAKALMLVETTDLDHM
jgi:quinol monooxygenase YgiN